MPHSWFLNLDMHLFLLSPIFLYLMTKVPKWGYICLSLLSIASIIAVFLIGYIYKLAGTFVKNFFLSERTNDFLVYLYYPMYARATPYFLGLMLYYFINKLKHRPINLSLVSYILNLLRKIKTLMFLLFL